MGSKDLIERCETEAERIRADISVRDRKIEADEEAYLSSDTSSIGSVFKGFEGFLSTKDTRRSRNIKIASKHEYLFSLSSASSDVWLQVQQSAETNEQSDLNGSGCTKFAQKSYAQKSYGQKGTGRR